VFSRHVGSHLSRRCQLRGACPRAFATLPSNPARPQPLQSLPLSLAPRWTRRHRPDILTAAPADPRRATRVAPVPVLADIRTWELRSCRRRHVTCSAARDVFPAGTPRDIFRKISPLGFECRWVRPSLAYPVLPCPPDRRKARPRFPGHPRTHSGNAAMPLPEQNAAVDFGRAILTLHFNSPPPTQHHFRVIRRHQAFALAPV
jgi:hypothetical protein